MTELPRLDRQHEWTGHWWLPEEPDRTVPGVLRYDPDNGLELSLIGGFEERLLRRTGDQSFAELEGTKPWPLIMGVADNKEITLLDCLPISSRAYGVGMDAPHKQTVSALTCLVGVHLEGDDIGVFTSALVSVENLTLWSDSSVFTREYGLRNGRVDGRGTLSVKPLDEPFVVVDGIAMTLAHEHTLPYFVESRGQTIGRMRDSVFVRFNPEEQISLAAARELATILQDLVSLATHRASALLWLRLRMPPRERDYPEGYPVRDREVAAYFQDTVRGDFDAKAVKHQAVLFTCGHIPFEEIMPRWWHVREKYQAAANMVLGLHYAPARYVEGNLLTAVGAAEALHRALDVEHTRMPAEDFKALREALVDAAPDEHRSWVKGTIRNDPTLRERLHGLAGLPDAEAMSKLVPDVEMWAGTATKARNDLAHTGMTPRQSLEELNATVGVTTAVVVMNLLEALGLSGERQREIVNSNPEIHHAAMQAASWLTTRSSA